MNCNPNCGYPHRIPGPMGHCQPPCPPPYPPSNQTPPPFFGPSSNFPIGMGYVPVQTWKPPYPIDRGFRQGTIFAALDYPFLMGRCR